MILAAWIFTLNLRSGAEGDEDVDDGEEDDEDEPTDTETELMYRRWDPFLNLTQYLVAEWTLSQVRNPVRLLQKAFCRPSSTWHNLRWKWSSSSKGS